MTSRSVAHDSPAGPGGVRIPLFPRAFGALGEMANLSRPPSEIDEP